MPKVSVIIPVYNIDEKKLRKGLDSLLAQTLQDIEFICVDDGSKNNEALILEEYKNKDPRFVIIRQENKGIGAARQTGIEHAAGEYIGFMDADDYISPLMYEKMYNQAKTLDSDIVECGFDAVLDWNKKVVNITNYDTYNKAMKSLLIQDNKNYRAKDFNNFLIYGSVWNKIFKKEFILNNKISIDTTRIIGEDSVFSLDAFLKAKRISFIHDSFYFYVMHSSSTMRTLMNCNQVESFRNNLYNVLKNNNACTENYKQCIDDKLLYQYLFYAENTASLSQKRKNYKFIKNILNKDEYKKFLIKKKKLDKERHRTLISNIFSIKNTSDDAILRKIIMFFGFKISFKKKRVEN